MKKKCSSACGAIETISHMLLHCLLFVKDRCDILVAFLNFDVQYSKNYTILKLLFSNYMKWLKAVAKFLTHL